jgi:hypothetical protein
MRDNRDNWKKSRGAWSIYAEKFPTLMALQKLNSSMSHSSTADANCVVKTTYVAVIGGWWQNISGKNGRM